MLMEIASVFVVLFIILFVMSLFAFGILWGVFEVIAVRRKEPNILSELIEKTYIRNHLYECTSCDRLFRKYQWDLVKSKKGKPECPHCQRVYRDDEFSGKIHSNGVKQIKKPDKWMDKQLDCPKVNVFDYLYLHRNIKAFERLVAQEEIAKRFEKYNKRDVSNWIEKLRNSGN